MKNFILVLVMSSISIILGIMLTNTTPLIISKFAPVSISSFLAGYIIKEKGWLFGVLIASLNIIAILLILITITLKVAPTLNILTLAERLIHFIPLNDVIFFFIFAAMGGLIGEKCRKLISKK